MDDSHSSELSQSQLSQTSAVSDTQLLDSSGLNEDHLSSTDRRFEAVIPDTAIYVGGAFIAFLVVGGILVCVMALRTTTSHSAAPPAVLPSGVHEGSGVGGGSMSHDHDQPSHLGLDDNTAETKAEEAKSTKPQPPAKKHLKTTSPPLVTAEEETSQSLVSEEGEATTTTVEGEHTVDLLWPVPSPSPETRSRNGAARSGKKGREPVAEEHPKEEHPGEEQEPAEEEPAAEQPSAEQPSEDASAEEEKESEQHPVVATTRRPVSKAPTKSRTKSKTVSHPLLCTVSSLAVEELRYPHQYCTHIIYTHAEFDFAKKSFVAPMASLSFTSFLTSKSKWANSTDGPRYLVSLSPAFVAQHAPEMSTGQRAARDMTAWLESTDLAGLALVEHVMTPDNADLYVKFSSAFREVQPGNLEFVLGFSSPYLNELQPTLKVLYSQVDYIILETHVKQFPDNCVALFPTAFNTSRNPKVLQLRNNLFPRSALQYVETLPTPGPGHYAKTCISVLMGVLMYIVPKGLIHAPSQDCIDFSWCTYSDVCQSKSKFKYYEWAEAVTQSDQSRMYMFDDETTIVNKVRKTQHASPKACVSLYRTDLDDFSGTCNNGSPFVRVAAVRRAILT
ncbi:hypothetical protein HPB50_017528 [Hyalomma asiaticum]|uniref:Uncharacterized protein n=1 Tax=Hyalomma asiaticum TaxID=266040 RepID=A0ACB7RV74_HYAAI|nr:hypothetical protein HPB50_017528 [Hyalomma asiaticum]